MNRSIIRRSTTAPAPGSLRGRKLDRTRGRLASELLLRELHGQADLALVHRLSGTAMDLEIDLAEAGRLRADGDALLTHLVVERVRQAQLLGSLVIRDHTT